MKQNADKYSLIIYFRLFSKKKSTFVEQSFNKTMKQTEIKDRIISETFDLLLHKGYDGVSITDIQTKLSISRGLLYHYFGNKSSLFCEAVKLHFGQFYCVELDIVASYNVVQLIDYMVDKYQKLTSSALLEVSIINYDFLFYRAMQEHAELTMLYDKLRKDEYNAWLGALENSRDQNFIRDLVDLELVARQFIYVTDGVWLSAATLANKVSLTDSLKEALQDCYALVKR